MDHSSVPISNYVYKKAAILQIGAPVPGCQKWCLRLRPQACLSVIYFLLYAPRVKAHPRGSGQPRGHSRPQVVSPGSSRPNEESIQPSAHSRKAGGGTLIPAPKAHADARRPCVQPRTQFGNPSTPIGSQGPFWAGGQAPPIHRATNFTAGRV